MVGAFDGGGGEPDGFALLTGHTVGGGARNASRLRKQEEGTLEAWMISSWGGKHRRVLEAAY
jgi:hypothetical protein